MQLSKSAQKQNRRPSVPSWYAVRKNRRIFSHSLTTVTRQPSIWCRLTLLCRHIPCSFASLCLSVKLSTGCPFDKFWFNTMELITREAFSCYAPSAWTFGIVVCHACVLEYCDERQVGIRTFEVCVCIQLRQKSEVKAPRSVVLDGQNRCTRITRSDLVFILILVFWLVLVSE